MSFPFAKRKFVAGADRSKYGKRHKPGQMNQTESAYAEILEGRKIAAEIIAWWFEGVTFKLADDTRYTPDFIVMRNDGSMECIDCKAAYDPDPKNIVKIKCAAEKFWQFDFAIEQKQAKKNGGGWKRTEY